MLGTGTQQDPYIISTESDLRSITDIGTSTRIAYYELANDIQMSTEPFTPIGGTTLSSYVNFNGRGHKISGLRFTGNTRNGLFGYLYNGRIEKVLFEDTQITTSGAGNFHGVVAGISYNAEIIEVGVIGGSVNTPTNQRVGGFIGQATGTLFTNCFIRNVDVTGSNYVGGFVGYLNGTANSFTNCYESNKVTATGTSKGGFTGFGNTGATSSNMYYDKTKYTGTPMTGDGSTGIMTVQFQYPAIVKGFNYDFTWVIEGGFPNLTFYVRTIQGSGTLEDPYIVDNQIHLEEIALTSMNTGTYYELTNDITISQDKSFIAISGDFNGTFNGNGHTIDGLYIVDPVDNSATSKSHGLFRSVGATGIVQNLKVINAYIENYSGEIGIITARNKGLIQFCSVQGHIKGRDASYSSRFGGIVGWQDASGAKVSNCFTDVKIEGSSMGGGIVGRNSSSATVEYSIAVGQILTNSQSGGIIGYNDASSSYTYRNMFDTITTGITSAIGYGTNSGNTGLTSEQLKTYETGIGNYWGEQSNWYVISGFYPRLYIYRTPMEGSGTVDDPYLIKNEEDLYFIGDNMAGNYKLVSDIEILGNFQTINSYKNQRWNATTYSRTFTGVLDGDGHTIINYYSKGDDYYGGLFHEVQQSALIKNLKFDNPIIEAKQSSLGLIANYLRDMSIVENVEVIGGRVYYTGTSSLYIGGLVGYSTPKSSTEYPIIRNCYIEKTEVKGYGGSSYTGGIVGYLNDNCVVINCISTAINKNSPTNGGLLVGFNRGDLSRSFCAVHPDSGYQSNSVAIATGSYRQIYYDADLTYAELTNPATYPTNQWDFTNTWRQATGTQPPRLLTFAEALAKIITEIVTAFSKKFISNTVIEKLKQKIADMLVTTFSNQYYSDVRSGKGVKKLVELFINSINTQLNSNKGKHQIVTADSDVITSKTNKTSRLFKNLKGFGDKIKSKLNRKTAKTDSVTSSHKPIKTVVDKFKLFNQNAKSYMKQSVSKLSKVFNRTSTVDTHTSHLKTSVSKLALTGTSTFIKSIKSHSDSVRVFYQGVLGTARRIVTDNVRGAMPNKVLATVSKPIVASMSLGKKLNKFIESHLRKMIGKSTYAFGDGTPEFPYPIYNVSDFARLNSERTKSFILMNNLDFTGITNISSITFSGTLDGNGKTIKNLKLTGNKSLFNTISGGTIRNLHIDRFTVDYVDDSSIGIFANSVTNSSLIENTYITNSTMNYKRNDNLARGVYGAFIGSLRTSSNVKNCYGFNNVVYGTNYVSGFIGAVSSSSVEDSYALETKLYPLIPNAYVGGIVASEGTGAITSGLYYDTTITDTAMTSYKTNVGTRLTKEQFKIASNFDFDFENVWRMGNTRPMLRVFPIGGVISNLVLNAIVKPFKTRAFRLKEGILTVLTNTKTFVSDARTSVLLSAKSKVDKLIGKLSKRKNKNSNTKSHTKKVVSNPLSKVFVGSIAKVKAISGNVGKLAKTVVDSTMKPIKSLLGIGKLKNFVVNTVMKTIVARALLNQVIRRLVATVTSNTKTFKTSLSKKVSMTNNSVMKPIKSFTNFLKGRVVAIKSNTSNIASKSIGGYVKGLISNVKPMRAKVSKGFTSIINSITKPIKTKSTSARARGIELVTKTSKFIGNTGLSVVKALVSKVKKFKLTLILVAGKYAYIKLKSVVKPIKTNIHKLMSKTLKSNMDKIRTRARLGKLIMYLSSNVSKIKTKTSLKVGLVANAFVGKVQSYADIFKGKFIKTTSFVGKITTNRGIGVKQIVQSFTRELICQIGVKIALTNTLIVRAFKANTSSIRSKFSQLVSTVKRLTSNSGKGVKQNTSKAFTKTIHSKSLMRFATLVKAVMKPVKSVLDIITIHVDRIVVTLKSTMSNISSKVAHSKSKSTVVDSVLKPIKALSRMKFLSKVASWTKKFVSKTVRNIFKAPQKTDQYVAELSYTVHSTTISTATAVHDTNVKERVQLSGYSEIQHVTDFMENKSVLNDTKDGDNIGT